MTAAHIGSLAAVCLALVASSAAASTGGRDATAPQAGRVAANAYARDIEARMRAARGRIVSALQNRRLRAGAMQRILGDVDAGIGAIRKRVATYGADGSITDAEDSDVKALANAIAADLANHHGAIAPWYLLP
jgi:hypothetical protein